LFRTVKGSATSSSVIPCSAFGDIKYRGMPMTVKRWSEAAKRTGCSEYIPTRDV